MYNAAGDSGGCWVYSSGSPPMGEPESYTTGTRILGVSCRAGCPGPFTQNDDDDDDASITRPTGVPLMQVR